MLARLAGTVPWRGAARRGLCIGTLVAALQLALLASAPKESDAQALTWEQISTSAQPLPSGREDAAIGFDAAGNRLFVFGGKDAAGTVLHDTWVFFLSNRTWEQVVTPTAPPVRFSMVAGIDSAHHRFIVATGQGAGKIFYNDVWALDIRPGVAPTWSLLPAVGDVPQARYGASGGVFWPNGTRLVVSHGFSTRRYSNSFVFDLATLTWTEIYSGTNPYNPLEPHARCLHGGAVTSDFSWGLPEYVLYGGCMSGGKSGGPCPARDGWHRDASGHWSQFDEGPTPRTHSAMCRLPGSVDYCVLYGGWENYRNKQIISVSAYPAYEVAVVNVRTGRWSRLVATPSTPGGLLPLRRYGHAMALLSDVAGGGMVMFGGRTPSGTFFNDVWVLSGQAALSPPEGGGTPSAFSLWALHGIFMFLGWGVCLQAGAFVARYFRHRDPWWFKVHRALQVSGLVLAIVGFALGIKSVLNSHFQFAHGGIGLAIMILGLQQPINAYFRPHKDEPRRKYWNYLHWTGGRVALLLALANIPLGMFVAVAPVGVYAVYFAALGCLFGLYVVFEFRLRKGKLAPSHPAESKGQGPQDHADDIGMVAARSDLIQ